MTNIAGEVAALMQRSRRVVVLTGAGISSESGIPTFRDALTGLWARFDAEALATPEAFERDPALVWGWYEWRRGKVALAQPNAAHYALAELEAARPETLVVTQNVDDLHERAGSRRVVHLHGSLFAPRCFDCGVRHQVDTAAPDEPEGGRSVAPPRCGACGGAVRPGVVWFGEALPTGPWKEAVAALEACDLVLVVGTSGLVYPAAGLPAAARSAGKPVVVVNPEPSEVDGEATFVLRAAAGVALPAVVALLAGKGTAGG